MQGTFLRINVTKSYIIFALKELTVQRVEKHVNKSLQHNVLNTRIEVKTKCYKNSRRDND